MTPRELKRWEKTLGHLAPHFDPEETDAELRRQLDEIKEWRRGWYKTTRLICGLYAVTAVVNASFFGWSKLISLGFFVVASALQITLIVRWVFFQHGPGRVKDAYYQYAVRIGRLGPEGWLK